MKRVLYFLKRWNFLIGWRQTVGWLAIRGAGALRLYKAPRWRVQPRKVDYPLNVRLGGTTDLQIFWQIFNFEEYSCLRDITSVRLILDLGANVGFSSAYLLSAFPSARVIAVEPDAGNFAACAANLAPYKNRAQVRQGAVWSHTTRLDFSSSHNDLGEECARQVAEPGSFGTGGVQAWDIPALLANEGSEPIDLLKVDIERAELAVFGEGARQWLPRTRNICIELHGEDCEKVFFRALEDYDYRLLRSGELFICRDLKAKAASA